MSGEDPISQRNVERATTDRRVFLAKTSSLAMAGGLVAGYGAFGAMAIRFLYPTQDAEVALRFVATVNEFKVGESREFTTPSGATVVIARHGASMMAPDYAHWHGMYEVAERFYMQLIPQAREKAHQGEEAGNVPGAQAVYALIDQILARPEHQWFEVETKKLSAEAAAQQ